MTAINHAVMGGLIAAVVPNPWIALPLALASHFVLDSLPHFGTAKIKKFFKVLYTDAFLVSAYFLILLATQPKHWLLIAIASFVAISPDIMWAPNGLRTVKNIPRKKLNAIMRFHKNIQWGERDWGLRIELPWLIIFSSILFLVER